MLEQKLGDAMGEGPDDKESLPPPAKGGGGSVGPPAQKPCPDGDATSRPAGLQPLAPLTFSVSWVRLMGTGFTALLFVAVGLLIIAASPEWGTKIIALVCVLLFGGGFAAVLWKTLRNPVVLTLSVDGIKPPSGGLIPWEDFEAVGMGRIESAPGRTKVIGIRLKSYEGYIASFTPAEIRLARASAVAGKFTGSLLQRAAPRSALRSARGSLQALSALPQRDIPGMLHWSRAMSGGWDVTFSPHLFKGRARDVVRKIEGYYLSALIARAGR